MKSIIAAIVMAAPVAAVAQDSEPPVPSAGQILLSISRDAHEISNFSAEDIAHLRDVQRRIFDGIHSSEPDLGEISALRAEEKDLKARLIEELYMAMETALSRRSEEERLIYLRSIYPQPARIIPPSE